MSSVHKLISSLLLSAALVFGLSPAVLAQSPSPLADQIKQDQHHLQGVEGQLSSIGDRIKTVEAMIAVAEGKRTDVEKQIKELKGQSDALIPELTAKTADYDRKRDDLRQAVLVDYHGGPKDAFNLMLQSGSVSETLAKSSYQETIDDHMDRLASDAQTAFDQLHDRKKDLDNKRSSLEVLGRQLTVLEQGIGQQRAELAELQANKSNEKGYLAERIARAKAAEAMILSGATNGALWGTYADGARVRGGDIIGLEGSTGFSTGCHLHFSAIQGGKWIDPQPLLDAGIFRRPDGGVTQPFGMTDYARGGAYGGGIHNGIDYVQPCGSPVRAARDGVIIRDNRTDGSGFGHYIMIRHDNGLITLYGHLI